MKLSDGGCQISAIKKLQITNYEKNSLDLIILIGGAVFVIPFLFSDATIDPVLSIRFLAWTVLTIIIILFFFIQGSRLRHSYDFTVIYRAIFPIAIGYAWCRVCP